MSAAVIVLLSIVLLLALLVHGRVPTPILFVIWAVGYYLAGFVPESVFLSSFTNPALATLIVLLMVSMVLERSRVVEAVSRIVIARSESTSVFRLSALATLLSAFLNNTAVVAGLLGVVCKQSRIAPSKLLIPLSYAAIVGGVVTLVGTSTNLVVNSLTVSAGLPPLTMFQFTWVGLPVALVCVLVLMWVARSLPGHGVAEQGNAAAYFLEAVVQAESPLVGRSIEANGLRSLDGLFLLEIVRGERLLSPVGPDEVLQAQDRLIFTGEVEKVQGLQKFAGLQLIGGHADHLLESNLIEVVVTQQSELVNRTLRDVDFRMLFDAGVVGIRRGDRQLTGQLGRIPLHVGDCLLLAAGADFLQRNNLERNFHLLTREPIRPRLRKWENRLVLAGFATVVFGSAMHWFSLLKGMLVLLGLMLVSGVLTPGEMRRRFPFDLWLTIGSSLVIATGMDKTGASDMIAQSLNSLFGVYGVWGSLVGIYLLTWVMTELVTNNAAAALAFPIALASSNALGVSPTPFIMVVAYAASAGFLLPFGYQTHLMVYSPGRYTLGDFLRAGWPIALVYAVTVLLLTPVFFPFK